MTKVKILGQGEPKQRRLKPIEFKKAIRYDLSILLNSHELSYSPNQMKSIQVIKRKGKLEFDTFFCEVKEEEGGGHCVYFGNFNDGVVE